MGGRGGRESWTGEFGSIFPLPSLLNGRCNRCRRRSVTRCQTKSNPISPKNDTQKVVATVFTLIVTDFKNTQKLTNYLAHFGWKICHQDHPKMAQSSHTAETTSWSKQQISSVAWSSVKNGLQPQQGRFDNFLSTCASVCTFTTRKATINACNLSYHNLYLLLVMPSAIQKVYLCHNHWHYLGKKQCHTNVKDLCLY